jgi:hypothetical protein
LCEDHARQTPTLAPYRWRRGQSGNPLGKAGVLAKRVREATSQGRDILDFRTSVMHDEREPTKHRLAAAHELLDRGWGRAVQGVELKGLVPQHTTTVNMLNLRALSAEELRTLVSLLERLSACIGGYGSFR